MDYIVVSFVALLVSGLTLFSGFGLGTVLMPAIALFFAVPVAIAATAVVHLANNAFKVILVGKNANPQVVVAFALPGAAAAVVGAALLNGFARAAPIYRYALGGQIHEVTLVKLVIGVLIVVFAGLELLPRFRGLAFDRKYLPLGGALSGFFGGLSGNQGALRSAFLVKSGLDKEAFIGTGVVSAVIVDAARLLVYGWNFYRAQFEQVSGIWGLVLAATLAALVGASLGARAIQRVRLSAIQNIVAAMLLLVGFGMATGLV